jgi:hypothetical protein
VVEPEGKASGRPATLWEALRCDPGHVPDLAVLHSVPLIAQHIAAWHRVMRARHPNDSPDQLATRVLRRSAGIGRRGGAITGSSFYIGMLPAMAMIYCEQLLVILRIAVIYGRDPTDPARLVEVLVIQGRYQTVGEATTGLVGAGIAKPYQGAPEGVMRTIKRSLSQIPTMLGIRLRKLRSGPVDAVVTLATWASFVVPIVSIPAWAVTNARATRRLARSAINFYGQQPTGLKPAVSIVLPPPPSIARRRLVLGGTAALGVALGLMAALLPFGRYHRLGSLGIALAEICLVFTLGRVTWMTRLDRSSRT